MSCISVVPVPKLIQAAVSPLLCVQQCIYFCIFRVGMPWGRSCTTHGNYRPRQSVASEHFAKKSYNPGTVFHSESG